MVGQDHVLHCTWPYVQGFLPETSYIFHCVVMANPHYTVQGLYICLANFAYLHLLSKFCEQTELPLYTTEVYNNVPQSSHCRAPPFPTSTQWARKGVQLTMCTLQPFAWQKSVSTVLLRLYKRWVSTAISACSSTQSRSACFSSNKYLMKCVKACNLNNGTNPN